MDPAHLKYGLNYETLDLFMEATQAREYAFLDKIYEREYNYLFDKAMKLWIPVEDETLIYESDMTKLEGQEQADFDHWESVLLSYKDITRQIKLP
jgi:hypothetical protein